jgi:hypothetical protein
MTTIDYPPLNPPIWTPRRVENVCPKCGKRKRGFFERQRDRLLNRMPVNSCCCGTITCALCDVTPTTILATISGTTQCNGCYFVNSLGPIWHISSGATLNGTYCLNSYVNGPTTGNTCVWYAQTSIVVTIYSASVSGVCTGPISSDFIYIYAVWTNTFRYVNAMYGSPAVKSIDTSADPYTTARNNTNQSCLLPDTFAYSGVAACPTSPTPRLWFNGSITATPNGC